MTEDDTVTNGWPDRVDWRDDLPDQAATSAEVIAAVEYLRCGDPRGALARLQSTGVPAVRHAVHALALLSVTLAAHTDDGAERVRLVRDDVLDWGDDGRHRDVGLTVLVAVDHWAAKDYAALDALVASTPFGPRQWAWHACWLIAGVCSGPGGREWLESVAFALRDYVDRQAAS